MQTLTHKTFRSIKTKLILALVVLSIVLTSLIIFLNYSTEFHKDLSALDQKLLQIKDTSVPSIVSVVWNLDIPYLIVQAESIVKIKDIVKIEVVDARGQMMVERFHDAAAINAEKDDLRVYKFPLQHYNKRYNMNEYLGTVIITATTKNIKANIYQRLRLLVLAEAIKTFLLCYLILLIIHHYFNKNLEQIIRFTTKFNSKLTENNYLHLERGHTYSDEIDILQDSINRMIQQLNFLNKEKEKKISEQEKKIEMQQAVAISSAKMAALGEMAGGIAHEINNPLTIIHTNTKIMEKMIEKGITDPALFLKSSQNIIKTVDRIGNIIKGLKNISRDISNEPKDRIAIKTILQDIISLCEEKFKHNDIQILCDMNNPLINTVINCFQVQLSQVFLNLFNNSFDAVVDLKEKWIKIDIQKNDQWLIIHFIDSGPGIPKSVRDKLFQPFFTTKEIGKGTGLGLSLIYGIIKNHEGEIFYNEHVANTCFTIKLPLNG